MLSISDAKRKLPKDFLDEVYNIYTPLTVDKILTGMLSKRLTSLRVNRIKYNIQDLMKFLKENNIKFDRVLWFEDALIIKNADEKTIQKLDIYEKGYIYLQSLSSMVPPIVLDPKPGEKVLDMTAAPGSKTTEIACFMNNNGEIIANELDNIRYERLKYNIDLQGASIVNVIKGRGETLGEKYPQYFDKVLLDTPCSGEGRFIVGNPGTYRDWSLRTVNELVKLQKKLIKSGYNALKPGGILVYSTCTINKAENEEIVKWALENFNLKQEKIDLKVSNSIEISDDKNSNALKILPSQIMEGFFVCKFRKLG